MEIMAELLPQQCRPARKAPLMSRATGYMTRATVLEQFEESWRRDPEAVALRYFGRDLDRDEVSRASDGVAALLVDVGVSTGDRVVLALQNTPGFVISMLGAWKAGAIVIPVNPMIRGLELGYVLADSRRTTGDRGHGPGRGGRAGRR